MSMALTRPLLQARLYGEKAGDYQLVNEWAALRGLPPLCETLLPPIGVIVEADGMPTCALWCYESFGIGVCHLDVALGRPSAPLCVQRLAFQFAIEACITLAKEHAKENGGAFDYFRCFTSEAVGRVLESLGWQCTSPPVQQYSLYRP